MSNFEAGLCRFSRTSGWIVALVTVLLGVVALVAPEDTLAKWAPAAGFSDLMAKVFPVIERYTDRSSFPGVTKLYMSLMFLAFPFGFLAPLCMLNRDRRLLVPIQHSQRGAVSMTKYVASAIFVVLVAPLLVYFHLYVNPGLDIFFMEFSRSRADLALFGFFLTLSVPITLGATAHIAVRLILGMKHVVSNF